MTQKNNTTNCSNLILKFETIDHQIHVKTLINVLEEYSSLLNIINSNINNGESEITLTVNAIKPGSVEIVLDICEEIKNNLLTPSGITHATNIISILSNVVVLYKYFFGKKADTSQISNVIPNSNPVNLTVINNIYNSPKTRQVIRNSIQALNEDTYVTGFEIQDEEGPTVNIPKKTFEALIKNDPEEIPENKKTEILNAVPLSLVKLSFNKKHKWEVIYNGNTISVSIQDPVFLKEIELGDSFSKGDSLIVDLEITKKFFKELNTYKNVSYKVIRVIKHIPAPKANKLF